MGNDTNNVSVQTQAPKWMAIIGITFIGITILFIMAIIFVSMFIDVRFDENTRWLIAIVCFLTMTVGSGSISGWATFKWKADWPVLGKIAMSAGGGIAAGAITFLLIMKFAVPSSPSQAFIDKMKEKMLYVIKVELENVIKNVNNFDANFNYENYKYFFGDTGIEFENIPN